MIITMYSFYSHFRQIYTNESFDAAPNKINDFCVRKKWQTQNQLRIKSVLYNVYKHTNEQTLIINCSNPF